jgi:hypothetical protein
VDSAATCARKGLVLAVLLSQRIAVTLFVQGVVLVVDSLMGCVLCCV